jgi:UDP-N-acetylmuramoyl-tripeptide--D-alanyl-D-alanine ligase
MRWIKENRKKILVQILIIIITTLLLIFNNIICNILSIIILGISIFYNFPKEKAKIELKITNRVKRMFITELILIIVALLINNKNYIYLKLCILNILTPIMCVIANFINFPLEYVGRQKYIRGAKKILANMPDLTVIGVTGSYGKTSVKNFLVKALEKKYEVLTTPKNYNTTMGVVKTIRENLKPTHQIFICEMGATKTNDIKEICDIVKPKFGVITSIGPQHLESFKSIENVIKTKFELADSVKENNGIIFLNYDNEYLSKQHIEQEFITYGINNSNLNYNAFNIKTSSKGSTFSMIDRASNKEIEFKTKLIGAHNVVNIAGAIAISNHLGIPLNDLVIQVKNLKSVEHRLELISHKNLDIIDDSYNSNPVSSKSALDTLSQFDGTKIIVTPGLIELGNDEEKYNFELGKYACNICDYIFLVNSRQAKYVRKGISFSKFNKNKIFKVSSPKEAMKKILELNISGKITVLLENDLPDNYNV